MLLCIEYGILFVGHCRYKDQSMQGIECYICCHCRYKTHPHIPGHNFLNIQWIINPQKVLES